MSLYEGGDREPLMVRWPGHVPAGRTDDTTVMSAVDFFPMFCKLAGTTPPDFPGFDGEDLSGAFFGKSLVRTKPLYWEYGRNKFSFVYPGIPHDRSPNVSTREGMWKLLINADGSNLELYNLDADRNESTNVAGQNPDLAQRLKEAALQWRKSLP